MSFNPSPQMDDFPLDGDELLVYLLEQDELTENRSATSIAKGHAERVWPSFGQQRLWYLEQLNPECPVYSIPLSLHLHGELQIDALRESLHAIGQRHDILRTTFAEEEGKLWQVIHAVYEFPFPISDLRAYPAVEKTRLARDLAEQDACQPFDLSCLPLWRAQLLRLADQEWLLLLNFHHSIFDGWSLTVFFAELSTYYQAFLKGEQPALAPLPIQYADYAHWQGMPEQQVIYTAQREYWQKQLHDAPALLDLPKDYPRPSLSRFTGERIPVRIDAGHARGLRALAHQENCSPYMVLLAIWLTLLYRYSRQEDLVVGTPVANRTNLDTEHLLGFFVNTLALRVSLEGHLSFQELLQRVRDVTLQAYEHQDLPFEQVVKLAQTARETSYLPLAQVFFSFLSTRGKGLQLPGLESSWEFRPTHTAKFDLQLDLLDDGQEISGVLEYSAELFREERIQRMRGHLDALLGAVASNPQQRLDSLPLLTTEEEQQLLIQWNQTRVAYPHDICLHTLVEAQVERTPGAEAVRFEGQCFTYSELNRRANQLAHYLQASGVRPETLVGVCLSRSLEMVIALLAILKAGGAYVPLDPDYPTERLAVIISDTAMPIILSTQALRTRLPEESQARILLMDVDAATWNQASQENPRSAASGDNLAYVIYTSGSTGTPKGVMNTHKGICNRLLWMQDAYQLQPSERVMQKTPFSFDVSVWEFFWPLMTGACLVVAQPDGHRDPAYLLQLIGEEAITTMHFVPSMLQIFLEMPDLTACHSLRRVVCSGEALTRELQTRFFERLGHCSLYNLYGPTEAAVDVTAWTCAADDPSSLVPIGRPIANMEIYILDEHLRPVPIGVPGELHIGGIGLARGYLNRPDLTEEKFIPHPFQPAEEKRLYKTGDLACYLPNGAIEFLGRRDYQVKLHGLRIELGEIETVLDNHPEIHQSVVMLQQDTRGQKRLVAYVVSTQEQNLSSEKLRAYLRQHLPSYMVPASFICMPALPLTASGKLNRRALPAPDLLVSSSSAGSAALRQGVSTEYAPPRDAVENALVEIWEKYLDVRPAGIHDRFEELGGDSLLLLQIIAQIHSAFHVRLAVRDVLANPTIAQIAVLLTQHLSQISNYDLLAQLLDEIEACEEPAQ